MRHPSDVPGDGRAEGAGEVGTDAGAGGGRDVAAGHGTSLLDWSLAALGPLGYAPARHHRLLIAELDRVATGDTDRLMLLMPPGSAKSTYASELFPAWFLAHHRRASIIAASHTASLALHFGRRVRTLALDHADLLGYRLDRTHRAAGSWSTDAGGEYYATGIRGPITGRRADLIVIDDPVKGRLEADSALARDQLWDWYRTDLATRLKPTGRIVLVMTRWHQDDLGGRLLGGVADETRGAGVPGDQRPGGRISGEDHWRVVRLPALAEADDPMGRREGEALWPEWEDADRLARKRATVGPRTWSALYQQLPAPDGGALFRVARVALLPAAPAEARYARAWDLAATAASHGRDPDWTVGLKLGREPSGRYVVADIMRLRGGPHEVEQAIVNTAAQDGRAVAIGLPQDPGQAGKQQVAWLAARLAGYRVVASPETGAKTTRAAPVSAQMDAGNFALVSAGWNRDFLDELRDFPQGRKDDQVDALSRAFALLADAPEPARRVNLPYLGR